MQCCQCNNPIADDEMYSTIVGFGNYCIDCFNKKFEIAEV